jgi:hypothetical protein
MRAIIALAAESLMTTNSWLNNFDSWTNAATGAEQRKRGLEQ